MKYKLMSFCAGLLFLVSGSAQAAITCSVTSPGFTAGYTAGTLQPTQTFMTLACTRAVNGDPTFIDAQVSAGSGLWASGNANRAKLTTGASFITYDPYLDVCATEWKTGGHQINVPRISWSSASDFSQRSQQVTYWGCITSQTGMPVGTYTDDFVMTATWGNGPNAGSAVGSAPVMIYAPANCTIAMSPGNMVFTYIAFGPQEAATKNFTATCNSQMPYSLAVSPTPAVLVGLNYSLALNTTSTTGTGVPQTFTITGTMAAGQAGDCPTGTCNGTQVHTVTVTY